MVAYLVSLLSLPAATEVVLTGTHGATVLCTSSKSYAPDM